MAQYIQYENKKGSFWRVRGYLGTDEVTGKQKYYQKSGFPTKTLARESFLQAISDFNNGVQIDNHENITYREVVEEWLDLYKDTVKESTLQRTRIIFRCNILGDFGDCRINKITPKMIQKNLNNWSKKYVKYKYIYRYFKRVMEYAYKHDYIKENPCNKVEIPKKRKVTTPKEAIKEYYTKDELKHFLELMKSEGDNRWYTFFHLLAYTGLRRGEMLALTWGDISFKDSTLTVNQNLLTGLGNVQLIQTPKTENSHRTIGLDSRTINVLKEWKTEQARLLIGFGHNVNRARNQLIFSTYEQNSHLPLTSPRNYLVNFCKRNNITPIGLHKFRHTHCSLLFESGVPMQVVKDRLGHSDIQTTMNIYTHVTEKSRDDSAELFARYMEI